MAELGIDLSERTPRALTRELAEQADVVVTMGCGDACPYIPGKRYIDWELPDPKGRPLDEVRATRDEIAAEQKASCKSWTASPRISPSSQGCRSVSPPVSLTLHVFPRVLAEVGRAEDEDLEALRSGPTPSPCPGRNANHIPLLDLDDLLVELHPPAAAYDHENLLLLLMRVAVREPVVGRDALIAQAGLLERRAPDSRRRNSSSGAPWKLDPTSATSSLRFLSVNGTTAILRFMFHAAGAPPDGVEGSACANAACASEGRRGGRPPLIELAIAFVTEHPAVTTATVAIPRHASRETL